jgi:hypothetical protein
MSYSTGSPTNQAPDELYVVRVTLTEHYYDDRNGN